MRKGVPTYLKLIVYLLVFLLVIPVAVLFALQIPLVQKYVSNKITDVLSSSLNTVVKVKRVGYSLDNHFIIRGIYVEDYDLDTLFYLDQASFAAWEFFRREMRFDKIKIKGLKIHITEDTTGYTNLLYFLDNLPASNPQAAKKKSKGNVGLYVRRIDIENCDLSYYKPFDSLDIGLFNPKNFKIYPLNFTIEDFTVKDTSYSFVLYDFSFTDRHSGFKVKNLNFYLSFSPHDLLIRDMTLQLSRSYIDVPKVYLRYDSIGQLAYPEKVYFFVNLGDSTVVNSQDLKFFVPQLRGYDFDLRSGFTLYGNMGDFEVNPFWVEFGRHTRLFMNGKIIGLPDVRNSYFDLEIDTFQTRLSDLTSLRDTSGKMLVQLPEQVYKVKFLSGQAKVTGLFNDLSYYANVRSNLGHIRTNGDFMIDTMYKASGVVIASDLDIGRLTGSSQFGKVSFEDTYKISVLDTLMWGETSLNAGQFEFNGYSYSDLKLDLFFKQKHFFLNLASNDPNLKLSADGEFWLSDLKKILLDISLKEANLYKLHFDKEDPNSGLAFGLHIDLKGHNINDVYGDVELSEPLVYIKNLEKLEMKKFDLTSVVRYYVRGVPYKHVVLRSDFADAQLTGLFEITSLKEYFSGVFAYYFPSLFVKQRSINALKPVNHFIGANLKLNLHLKNLTPVTRIFTPQIQFSQSTDIFARYIDTNHTLLFNYRTDSVKVGKNLIYHPEISLHTTNDSIVLSFEAQKAFLGILSFDSLFFVNRGANDSVFYDFGWNNKDNKKENFALVKGYVAFDKEDSLKIQTSVTYDTVVINGVNWSIQTFDLSKWGSDIDINTMFIDKKQGQIINIVGRVSPNPEDSLMIGIERFDLSQLSPLFDNLTLGGYLKGSTKIKNILKNPLIYSNNRVSGLKVNNVDLATLIAMSDFDTKKNLLTFKVLNEKIIGDTTRKKLIELTGDYDLNNEKLTAILKFNGFRIKTIQPYVSKVLILRKYGVIDGNIQIESQNKDFNVLGDLQLASLGFIVKPTNVGYTVQQKMKIHFDNDKITVDTTKLIANGLEGKAKLWGDMKKNVYEEYVYNFGLLADKLLVLNLPEHHGHNYYGKAYFSGAVNFTGIGNSFSVNADVQTEEGTNLTFLINTPKTIAAQTDFITFINHDSTSTAVQALQPPKTKTSNLDLNVNLSVSPDSKFNIVINEQTGEQLTLQGNGILNIKMTPFGGLLLYGTLTIDQGDYNFSLENIITKKFKIQAGSTIKWNGNPTDAQLNLTTIYSLKSVNLYDLTLDDNYWGERTPVNCLVKITGTLQKPEISFDLDLPKADQRIISQVKNLDEAEKTKQVLSLLILGKFQPLPGLAFDPNQLAGNMSATDVLSSQLSNLVSNLDENLELGVNYQGKDQLEVALSYKLWNERVIINTDVGIGNKTPTATSQPEQLVGDVEVEVKLNKKGNVRFKAFNKTNRNEFFDKGPYTQGVGIFFQKDFSTLLPWQRKKQKKAKDLQSQPGSPKQKQ